MAARLRASHSLRLAPSELSDVCSSKWNQGLPPLHSVTWHGMCTLHVVIPQRAGMQPRLINQLAEMEAESAISWSSLQAGRKVWHQSVITVPS